MAKPFKGGVEEGPVGLVSSNLYLIVFYWTDKAKVIFLKLGCFTTNIFDQLTLIGTIFNNNKIRSAWS